MVNIKKISCRVFFFSSQVKLFQKFCFICKKYLYCISMCIFRIFKNEYQTKKKRIKDLICRTIIQEIYNMLMLKVHHICYSNTGPWVWLKLILAAKRFPLQLILHTTQLSIVELLKCWLIRKHLIK